MRWAVEMRVVVTAVAVAWGMEMRAVVMEVALVMVMECGAGCLCGR
jgi:hypothetical protein